MKNLESIFSGKRILVTGHTGFKGSWLSLWLHELGADVSGISLPPATKPSHWDLLKLPINQRFIDIRDQAAFDSAFKAIDPEVVFHLAAQPLVRRSYRIPTETWSTNVMGTVNVLEACRSSQTVKAILVVTTDKCYENHEWPWGYRETDRLGGYDPYSASKACAELICSSYRSSYFSSDSSPLLATARAGNVIGGGDWSEDRLVPDLIRAIEFRRSLEIRSPHATRPWQHVLESLHGYIRLASRLINGERDFADAWNFGPDQDGNRTVEDVLKEMGKEWSSVCWHSISDSRTQPHEASLLYLDSSKAKKILGWQPTWGIEQTVLRTISWYRTYLETGEAISRKQLQDYIQEIGKA